MGALVLQLIAVALAGWSAIARGDEPALGATSPHAERFGGTSVGAHEVYLRTGIVNVGERHQG